MPPGAVAVFPAQGGVIVGWNTVPGAESYSVYLASDPSISPEDVDSLPNGRRLARVSSPLEVRDLPDGVEFHFVVTGQFPGGKRPASPRVAAGLGRDEMPDATLLAGTVAMARSIRNATGTVARLDPDGTEEALSDLRGDASGRYSVVLSGSPRGPVQLRFSSGVFADHETGNDRMLSSANPLEALSVLHRPVNLIQTTPLTTFGARLFGQLENAPEASAVEAVNRAVGLFFGVRDPAQVEPAELARLQEGNLLSRQQLRYALVLAGLAALAEDTLELMALLAQDGSDGVLEGRRFQQPLDGIQATQSASDDSTPAWPPDGTQIAFASNRAGTTQIYLMNADGQSLVQVTSTPSGLANWHPTWSPDGTKLAYVSGPENVFVPDALTPFPMEQAQSTALLVVETSGGTSSTIVPGPGLNLQPAWSPDGQSIAFSSNRDGSPQIYTIRPEGQNLRPLTNP